MHNTQLEELFEVPVPVSQDAESLLNWAAEEFSGSIALSTSLGPQTLVVLDLLHKMGKRVPAFVIDTGFLFPETYQLLQTIEERYQITLERAQTRLTIVDQASQEGEGLWSRAPDRCCAIRKVLPLRKRLGGLRAWITGLRRDPETPSRAGVEGIEWDVANGLFKVNPLWSWSQGKVLNYAKQQNIPLNPLLEQGYKSIGCTHCTAKTNGSERSGRWQGHEKTECGLHYPTLFKNKALKEAQK